MKNTYLNELFEHAMPQRLHAPDSNNLAEIQQRYYLPQYEQIVEEQPFVAECWHRLLAGEAGLPVFPHWFFGIRYRARLASIVRNWTEVFGALDEKDARILDVRTLSARLRISKRKICDQSELLFSSSPGLVLRVWRNFMLTSFCDHTQQQLRAKFGDSRSIQSEMPGDFRRTLKRLIGMSYHQLRQQAPGNNWPHLWMIAWQRRQEFRANELSPVKSRQASIPLIVLPESSPSGASSKLQV